MRNCYPKGLLRVTQNKLFSHGSLAEINPNLSRKHLARIWKQEGDIELREMFEEEEEDDPRVGGQWRIATLSRRGKCSPAAGT
jgi:hypothetical protein